MPRKSKKSTKAKWVIKEAPPLASKKGNAANMDTENQPPNLQQKETAFDKQQCSPVHCRRSRRQYKANIRYADGDDEPVEDTDDTVDYSDDQQEDEANDVVTALLSQKTKKTFAVSEWLVSASPPSSLNKKTPLKSPTNKRSSIRRNNTKKHRPQKASDDDSYCTVSPVNSIASGRDLAPVDDWRVLAVLDY